MGAWSAWSMEHGCRRGGSPLQPWHSDAWAAALEQADHCPRNTRCWCWAIPSTLDGDTCLMAQGLAPTSLISCIYSVKWALWKIKQELREGWYYCYMLDFKHSLMPHCLQVLKLPSECAKTMGIKVCLESQQWCISGALLGGAYLHKINDIMTCGFERAM